MQIGPAAGFKLAITVARLPKTRSRALDHAGDDRRSGDTG
jgi:hypothetical protein